MLLFSVQTRLWTALTFVIWESTKLNKNKESPVRINPVCTPWLRNVRHTPQFPGQRNKSPSLPSELQSSSRLVWCQAKERPMVLRQVDGLRSVFPGATQVSHLQWTCIHCKKLQYPRELPGNIWKGFKRLVERAQCHLYFRRRSSNIQCKFHYSAVRFFH